jgi:hypothetical protein
VSVFRLQGRHERPRSSARPQMRDEAKKTKAKQPLPLDHQTLPSPVLVGNTILDPFLRFSVELSVPDQHLLRLYLDHAPHCGSSAEKVDSILRGAVMQILSTNDIFTMCTLVAYEALVASCQPTPEQRKLSVLKRKTLVYSLLKSRLDSELARVTDNYILSVTAVAQLEHKLGNAKSAGYHIEAARKLLELRGGFKALRHVAFPGNLEAANAFIMVGSVGLFQSWTSVQEMPCMVVQWIKKMQAWHFAVRASTQRSSPKDLIDGAGVNCDYGIDLPHAGEHQSSQRTRLFAPGTALFDLVSLPESGRKIELDRYHLSILFFINSALHAFRDSETTTRIYLQELATVAEMNADRSDVLKGEVHQPSFTLIQILAHNAIERGEDNEFTQAATHFDEGIFFVEVIMASNLESRICVSKTLASWLTTPMTLPADLLLMSASKLNILAEEVEGR